MSNILLITYHNALSYGACLQAIATVKVLESEGHDVTVVDFQNEYEARQKGIKFLKYGSFKEIIISFVKRILFQYDKCKKVAFGDVTKHYRMTQNQFLNILQMQELVADTLIVGSDQVWNSKISGGLEKAFFLDFGKVKRKVSYSSSMGNYVFSEEEKEYVTNALKNFDAISVRENYTEKQIRELTDKKIHIMLDPTLLMSKFEWREFYNRRICNFKIQEKYILAFVICNHEEDVSEIYTYYKRKMKLPVAKIMLNTYRNKGVDRVVAGATPEEFIQLIDNAQLVITDSFHGMAFSINMETPFVLVPVKNGSIRMFELLEKTQLEEQIYHKDRFPKCENIDFTNARNYLEKKRSDDKAWISKNVF